MTADAAAVRAAFLDVVAIGESEPVGTPRGSGYNILVGGSRFTDYSKFPEWAGVKVNGTPTHAAGRFQDEPKTWAWIAEECHLDDFSPASQDSGNWWLAQHTYNARTQRDLGTDLAAGRFADVVPALRSTWPSLSEATFASRFRAALGVAAPIQVPAPAPTAAPQSPVSTGVGVGIGGTAAAALAQVLIWASHWPLQPLDSNTALSLAALVLSGVGMWMHIKTRPAGGAK
jgi:muramidase (phage lysozyme)